MRSLADAYQRPTPRVYRVRYRRFPPWERYQWEALLFYTDGTECCGVGHTLEDAYKSATHIPVVAWKDGEPLTWGDLIHLRPDILD